MNKKSIVLIEILIALVPICILGIIGAVFEAYIIVGPIIFCYAFFMMFCFQPLIEICSHFLKKRKEVKE